VVRFRHKDPAPDEVVPFGNQPISGNLALMGERPPPDFDRLSGRFSFGCICPAKTECGIFAI